MSRVPGICRMGAAICSFAETPFLKVEGAKNIVDGTAIYVLKHQSYRDIWGMGVVLYRHARAYAYYPMKSSLPKWLLEPFGGISIYRSEDIKKLLRKETDETRRESLKLALKQKTREQFNTLAEIIRTDDKNSSVVICAEGHRYRNCVGPLHREGINMLLSAEDLPVVPVGTEYHGWRATFRLGEPRKYGALTESVAEELRTELGALSRCPVLISSRTGKVRAV